MSWHGWLSYNTVILIMCVCANIIYFLLSQFKLVCLWIVNVQIIFECVSCLNSVSFLNVIWILLSSMHDIYIASPLLHLASQIHVRIAYLFFQMALMSANVLYIYLNQDSVWLLTSCKQDYLQIKFDEKASDRTFVWWFHYSTYYVGIYIARCNIVTNFSSLSSFWSLSRFLLQ